MDILGAICGMEKGLFLVRLLKDSEAHPTFYPTRTSGISYGVKRLGRETNEHAAPSSAEAVDTHIFMALCLVKHRDNLTFTYTCYNPNLPNTPLIFTPK
jgi:hypothetical protein